MRRYANVELNVEPILAKMKMFKVNPPFVNVSSSYTHISDTPHSSNTVPRIYSHHLFDENHYVVVFGVGYILCKRVHLNCDDSGCVHTHKTPRKWRIFPKVRSRCVGH